MTEIAPIAHIRSPFATKFGIPRQSNILMEITSEIVFTPDYRVSEALRGIEDFDYLWLIWQFSENLRSDWSPTVRPPRLGGNKRMGVFATRSSFRPNALALSSVRLLEVRHNTPDGPILVVQGADLMDGTPIFDIKPYLPYTDSHPEARSGFAPAPADHLLEVRCDEQWLSLLPPKYQAALLDILAHDPRPSYHNDPSRQYGFLFANHEIRFQVFPTHLQVLSISQKEPSAETNVNDC